MLNRINSILEHMHQGLLSWVLPHSPGLAEVIDDWFLQNRLPKISLVAGACKAAGGNPEDPKLLRIMTSLLPGIISMDILNDYQEKNNAQALWIKLGTERTMHYSHMLQVIFGRLCMLSNEDVKNGKTIVEKFQQSLYTVLAARNRNNTKEIPEWDTYWKNTELSEAQLTGALCLAGAELATGNKSVLTETFRDFGIHLGLSIHILHELVFFSNPGRQFPGTRNIHLSVLYGIQCDHPNQMELKQIVWQDHLELQSKRVKEILDAINTRDYLVWAAHKEKDKAIDILQQCPDAAGKDFLETFIREYFIGIPSPVVNGISELAGNNKLDIPPMNHIVTEELDGILGLDYQSIGLGIRKNIRSKPLQINY